MRYPPSRLSADYKAPALRSAVLLLLTSILLSACGTTGGDRPATPPAAGTTDQSQPQIPPGTPRVLPPSEFAETFRQIEQELDRFNWMAAEAAIAGLPQAGLTATDGQYLAYLEARIEFTRGRGSDALEDLQEALDHTLQPALRYKMLDLQREIYQLSGAWLASAQLGAILLPHAQPGPEFASLKRSIWRNLLRTPDASLRNAVANASDPHWLGWLQLAQLGLYATQDPSLEKSIDQWRAANPGHPADAPLPGGLDFLAEASVGPAKVTLLLPLSGRLAPVARAVRDGYLANYYAARVNGGGQYEVEILDTLAFDSVTSAYQQAVAGGSDFIVGPLSKPRVSELARLEGKTVPVLALNRIENPGPPGDIPLVQLSLAPEDEAAQIATLAFGHGARRALIIRPAGSWGNKMDQALRARWRELGGSIAATATYSSRENYSSSMSDALNLPSSKARAREIRRMLGTKVEATARRRQDIDAVFLLSKSSAEARSLKPLLAYHYASDLPVYATSSIYRGVADKRDQDLNGIVLVETPWILDSSSAAKNAIVATAKPLYPRLNALGADAFLLQTVFPALRATEDMLVPGSTGLLSITPALQVKRELQIATFDGGKLVAQ